MPELCLVYFKVEVVIRGAARKTALYGQNCIPLESIVPGVCACACVGGEGGREGGREGEREG